MLCKKRFWGFWVGGLLPIFYFPAPLSLFWNRAALLTAFNHLGPWQALAFIIAHIVTTAIGIPATPLVVAGGAMFGLFWGTFWSVLGATLGAVVAFCLSRYLLHDWFKQRFSHRPRFQRLNQAMDDQGFRCVLTVRFAPISPFNLINFLLGLTAVSLPAYTLGTFVGIIPGTLAYTWLGVTGIDAFSGKGALPLILCLSLLTVLSLVPFVVRRFRSV